MDFKIKQEMGHYVMYVNGSFYGSYDSVGEAFKDIDEIMKEMKQDA